MNKNIVSNLKEIKNDGLCEKGETFSVEIERF